MSQGPNTYRCVRCNQYTSEKDGIATADKKWWHDECHKAHLAEKARKREQAA